MSENTEAKQEMSLLEILNLHGLPAEHKAMAQLQRLMNIVETLAKIARGGGGEMGVPISQQLLDADEILYGVKKRDMSLPEAKLEKLADKMKTEQSRDTAATEAGDRTVREIRQYEAEWPMGLKQGPPSIIGDQIIFKSSRTGAPLALCMCDVRFVAPDVDNYNGKDQNRFSLVENSRGVTYPVEHPMMVILNVLAENI